jgi:hypothetical protein
MISHFMTAHQRFWQVIDGEQDGSVCYLSNLGCKDFDIPAAARSFCSLLSCLNGWSLRRIFAFTVSGQFPAFCFTFG